MRDDMDALIESLALDKFAQLISDDKAAYLHAGELL